MTLEQELALAALRHEEIRTEVADGTVLLDNDVSDTTTYDWDKVFENDSIPF